MTLDPQFMIRVSGCAWVCIVRAPSLRAAQQLAVTEWPGRPCFVHPWRA